MTSSRVLMSSNRVLMSCNCAGCWVVGWELFFGHPVLPSTPRVSILQFASTLRRHTLEVCAPQGPGQALPAPYQRHVAGTSRQCACAVSLPNCLCILVKLHTEEEAFKPSLCGSTQPTKFSTLGGKEGQSRVAQDDLQSWFSRPSPLDLQSEKVSEGLLFES